MRHHLNTAALLLTVIAVTGCGKSACEELEDKKCACHDELCEEAESQDSIELNEEVCEELIRDWDCEEQMADQGLERFNAID